MSRMDTRPSLPQKPDAFHQLTERERDWIDSKDPVPVATMTKTDTVAYLQQNGMRVTFYAVKTAVESGELPNKKPGKARLGLLQE